MRFALSRRVALRALSATALSIAAFAVPTAGASAAPRGAGGIAGTSAHIAHVQRQLSALGNRIDKTVEDYDSARLALAAADKASAAATARADAARRDLEAKRRMLSAFAVSAYQSGGVEGIAVAVTGNPGDYLDRMSALDAVSRRQADIVTLVASAQKRYAAAEDAARAALAAAQRVTNRIAATKAAIEKQIAAERKILDGLRAEQARLERIAAEKAAAGRQAAAQQAGAAAYRVRSITSHRGGGSSTAPRHAPPVSGRAAAAVRAAYSVLGRPYSYGAGGPGSFDCSGLTSWAWGHAGVSLPHSSGAQYGAGQHVSRSALRPGDLLFFYSPIHHVGIYVGGGRMIDAPHTGTVVSVRSPLWSEYVGAVRPG